MHAHPFARTSDYTSRAPPGLGHAHDTQPRFSAGYPLYNHEAHSPAEPPAFTYATGTTPAHLSYASPSSVAHPYSTLARPVPWNNPASDKSTGPSWPSALNHPPLNMAVPYSALPDSPDADSAQSVDQPPPSSNGGSSSPEPRPAGSEAHGTDGKEKKHGCWMCYKSFDRPSTLKKHLLVHTGEKAFACETCGRRFGVASNLNRHAKRCALRPVNMAASAKAAAVASPGTSSSAEEPAAGEGASRLVPTAFPPPSDSASAPGRARKRKPAASEDGSASTPGAAKKPKRQRRAPSPSRWVPDSLKTFDLTLPNKGTPTPLPPVRPFRDNLVWEERDSFDENVSARPYHPQEWRNRLPGPGLMGKDIVNTSGGSLLIF